MKSSSLIAAILALACTVPAQVSPAAGAGVEPAGLTETGAVIRMIPAVSAAEGEVITISTAGREAMGLEELLGWWTEVTDRKFTYNETEFRGKPRISIVGTIQVKRKEADALFQALLVRNGFALVPAGTPGANTWAVEHIPSSQSLRQSATFVPEERIQTIREQAALVFMTTIQLKNIRVENIRSATTQILTNRQAEFSAESPGSNSITVIGFGPTLAMLHSVIENLDRPMPETVPEPEIPGMPRQPKKDKDGSEGKD